MTSLAQAWSNVVTAEDAAIYAYGVAGARLKEPSRSRAHRILDEHRTARTAAAGMVTAAGGEVPPPAAVYSLPGQVNAPSDAQALLAHVENALVPYYAAAAGASPGGERRPAARRAAECAVRAIAWGADPQAFPS